MLHGINTPNLSFGDKLGLRTPPQANEAFTTDSSRVCESFTPEADRFGSDDELMAFLEGWSKTDAPTIDQLADVAAPSPAQAPQDDATAQIEMLVARNRECFQPRNATPARLLMSEDAPIGFAPTAPPDQDLNTWQLFDASSH